MTLEARPPRFTPGTTALYAQLASLLRSRILNGEWADGQEIPSLQKLADLYGLGRVTVRQAIQVLVKEGLLSSQRGRNTFVTFPGGESSGPTSGTPLFTSVSAIEHQALNYSVALLSRQRVDHLPSMRWQVGIDQGPYMHILKLDQVGSSPYGLSSVHVAEDLYKRFPKGAEAKEKLAQLVRSHGQQPSLARERITVLPTDFEAAAALNYPMAAPAAKVERVFCDAYGRVIYLAVTTYRGDQFGLERNLAEYFQ